MRLGGGRPPRDVCAYLSYVGRRVNDLAAVKNLRIPPLVHFVWLGTEFPWLNYVAIRSAAERSGMQRVLLHHRDDLDGSPWYEALRAVPRVELHRLADEALLSSYDGEQQLGLRRCLAEATGASQQSDIYRLLLLAKHGGVYLDMDTVTVRPFVDLCAKHSGFLGEDRIIYPHWMYTWPHRWRHPAAWVRVVARDLCRRLPNGWRPYRRIEKMFHLAVNNAIWGSAATAPFLQEALRALIELPAERRRGNRSAVGPHLLQRLLARRRGDDVKLLPPAMFYPLPPEISEQWFRLQRHLDVSSVLLPDTRIVHWYASVRTRDWVPRIDPSFVRAHADRQMISQLCLPFAVDPSGTSPHVSDLSPQPNT